MLCEQIDETVSLLARRRLTGRDIHEARKSAKRARATLRLIHDAIPERVYQRENLALRDAGRGLSSLRDARVLMDTLKQLERDYGAAGTQAIPSGFRRVLSQAHVRARRTSQDDERSPTASLEVLRGAHRRIVRWRIDAYGWGLISKGLKRVYAKGRKAMKQACRTPTASYLHEWRKQAKYLGSNLRTLESAFRGHIGKQADQAHKLSDYLGDDHDLYELREKVAAHRQLFTVPGQAGALLSMIDRCQRRLRKKAFAVGKQIYEEKPATFVKGVTRSRK